MATSGHPTGTRSPRSGFPTAAPNHRWCLQLGGSILVVMGGAIASFGDDAIAQIVPDATLGSESSVVTPNAGGVDVISGGATRGANLFHSFQQFSVLIGGTAFFNKAADIQKMEMLPRVDGKSVSPLASRSIQKRSTHLQHFY